MCYAQVTDEEDTQWHEGSRESPEQLMARGVRFVQYLVNRPESRIAVVSHSSFLYHLMINFGHQASQPVTVRSLPTCFVLAWLMLSYCTTAKPRI